MLQYFFKSLHIIGCFLLACIAALFFMISTQPGLYCTLYLAKKLAPGTLTYQSAEGSLLRRFSINQLRYQDASMDIQANRLFLQWQPSGLLHREVIITTLDTHQFNLMGISIEDIHLSGNILLTDTFPFSLNLHWEKAQTAVTTSGGFNLSGDIHHYSGLLDASLQFGNITYPVNARVDATPTTLDGTVIAEILPLKKRGIRGDFSPNTHLNTLLLITLKGQHTPKFNLNWTIQAPNLTRLSSFVPNLSGSFNAEGTIKGTTTDLNVQSILHANKLTYQQLYIKKILSHLNILDLFTKKESANLDIQLNPGDLIYIHNNEKNRIPFKKFNTQLAWKRHILTTNIEWIFDTAKRFEANCQIYPIALDTFDIKHLERQKLSGQLLFNMSNLDFANTPSSPVKQIKGTFGARINVKGTLAKPLWDGEGNLNAEGYLPDLGITLNQVNVILKTTPKNMSLMGKIVSGKNVLSLAGESSGMYLQDVGIETFTARLTGEHFPVMHTKEYQIYATPHLALQWDQKKGKAGVMTIRGTIDIPAAKVTPLSFTQSLELPADVVFVSNKKQKKEETDTMPLLELDSQINVRLGDDVQINTHGITGKLAGSLMIIDKNNTPTTGQGEIHSVDGAYNAYGQTLTMQKGQANFVGGPIDNPQLLIRAVRIFNTTNNLSPDFDTDAETSLNDFNKITVGIEVTGTVENPIIKLFSEPATLSQADMLSFLVLGKPMSQASSGDGALLAEALYSMNMGNGQQMQIIQQLQQTFGLDVLNVETSSQYSSAQNAMTNSNTSVVIGKKLSPRLFIDYSIGIIQNKNILKVKYLLTPHWIFQTSTDGINEGVDIIYNAN